MEQEDPKAQSARGDDAHLKKKMRGTKLSVRKQTVGYLRDPFTGNLRFRNYPGMTRKPGKRQQHDSPLPSQRMKCSYSHAPPGDIHREDSQSEQEDLPVGASLGGKDLYVQLLIQYNGYTVADAIGSSTVVQEFNENNISLEENSFQCIYRRPVKADEYMWAYTCSCEKTDHEEVSNLDPVLEEADISSKSDWCIHIQAGMEILEQLDAEKGMDAAFVFNQLEEEGLQDHIYSCARDVECSVFKLNGSHDTTLLGVILASEQLRAQQYGVLMWKGSRISCLTCRKPCKHVKVLSELHKNEQDMSDNLREIINSFFQASDTASSAGTGIYHGVSQKKIPFFRSQSSIHKMRVGFRGLAHFDSGSGLYSLSPNKFSCPSCQATLDTVIVRENAAVFLCHNIEYSRVSKEVCSNCGAEYVYDGQDDLVLNMGSYLVGHEVLRSYLHSFCRGKDRVYVKHKEVRMLVQSFCSSTKELNDEDMRSLIDLTKKHYPSLSMFLDEISDGTTVCPPQFRNFLTDVVANYSVCAIFLPIPEVEQLMADIFSGINLRKYPSKWSSLHQHVPILFELFCSDHSLLPVPEKLTALLMDMWEIAKQTFQGIELQHECSGNVADSSRAYFPMLEQLHCRGSFAADNVTSRPAKCHKRFPGHPSLLPGIFTIFCEHGVCYGFQVMETCESPNVPFTIFSTRFKKAPTVIVYDFACSLQAYCLNRDPVFFQGTRFVVDRFHWRNHNACPSAYNLSKYPSLEHLNSQMNEQANSGLKRIKDQLSYMSEKHFMAHCKLFLFKKNVDAKKSC